MALNLSGWLPNLIGPLAVKVAGVAQTARAAINFVGVSAVDDEANDQLTLTVAAPTGTGIPHVVSGVQVRRASASKSQRLMKSAMTAKGFF